MDFQREGASGYASRVAEAERATETRATKAPRATKATKAKGERDRRVAKRKERTRKVTKAEKETELEARAEKRKKTDVCRNCGKTGHWARDCWAPPKDKAAAATSQAVTAKAAAQPTTKGSGKTQYQSKRFWKEITLV